MFEPDRFSTYSEHFKSYAKGGVILFGAGYSISLLPDTQSALDTLRDDVSFIAYTLGVMDVAVATIHAADIIRHKLKPTVK